MQSIAEEWRDIRGYKGLYQVSNCGNVRSLDRTQVLLNCHGGHTPRKDKGHLLTPTDNGNGYLIVGLNKNGKRTNKYVHRLVAETFCFHPYMCDVVNHKDYNRSNNNSNNLEWVTQLYNTNYSREHMRVSRNHRVSSRTGEKYISIVHDHRNKSNQYYRVQAYSSKYHFSKLFKTLEDAIIYRNEVVRR